MKNFHRCLELTALRRLAPVVLLLSLLAACNDDNPIEFPLGAPNTVTINRPGFFPEGIQYDAANRRFLVSSLSRGAIGRVKDDGTYTVFTDHPAVVSSLGMYLDVLGNRNRLLVAVADMGGNPQRSSPATLFTLAKLAIFSVANPAAPVIVDLGGLRPGLNHLANDLTVDAEGNVYVTDTLAPIIYKVDAQTNVATVFVEDARLGAPAGMSGFRGLGLNGIVYHPDGYLLVNKSNDGALYKVPLNNPTALSRVLVPGLDLRGADGMLLQDQRTLQVVSYTQNKVFRLSSPDAWATGTSAGTFIARPETPTTLARRRGADSYVLYANLLVINQPPVPTTFTIGKVKF